MFSTNWESGGLGKWSLNNTDIVGAGIADFRLPIAKLVYYAIRRPKTKSQIGNWQSEIGNIITQTAS
jgi:hypothetical protein